MLNMRRERKEEKGKDGEDQQLLYIVVGWNPPVDSNGDSLLGSCRHASGTALATCRDEIARWHERHMQTP